MIVKGKAQIEFERRWTDYRHVLEFGPVPSVGAKEPALLDCCPEIEVALKGDGQSRWNAANAALDRAWAQDRVRWPRRLLKFLTRLSGQGQRAFTELVRAGCQPDSLAFQFCEAASVREGEQRTTKLILDLDALQGLSARAIRYVTSLSTRRRQFDEYMAKHKVRVIEGEPGNAELQILAQDFVDLMKALQADDNRLRRLLDGRRETLVNHAEWRLSSRVRESTGSLHDAKVAVILDDLRERVGLPRRGRDALKQRRARYSKRSRELPAQEK